MKTAQGFAAALLLALGGCSDAGSPANTPAKNPAPAPILQGDVSSSDIPTGTGFDFYVLALSWSPSYCAAQGDKADRRQCGRDGPDGFVVHGLWPQYDKGYPADCKSSEPDRVPQQLLSSVRGLFPSDSLAAYEWRKHGTCSGLTQKDYFDVVRQARTKVRIPPALGGGLVNPHEAENAFIKANRGLDANEISVDCDRTYLREIRVCLSKTLDFIACPQVDRQSCRLNRAAMPNKR